MENTFAATAELDLVAGVSYEENELEKAQDFNAALGLFEYPTGGSDATNAQGAAYWRYAEGPGAARRHFLADSLSRRSSSASARASAPPIPNPDLEPERAVNYELGWSMQPSDGLDLTAALFYADIEDMIQTVVVSAGPPQLTQTQNVGDGEFYGVELGVHSRLAELWSVDRELHVPRARDHGRVTARLSR